MHVKKDQAMDHDAITVIVTLSNCHSSGFPYGAPGLANTPAYASMQCASRIDGVVPVALSCAAASCPRSQVTENQTRV